MNNRDGTPLLRDSLASLTQEPVLCSLAAVGSDMNSALHQHVLVLNRLWQAVNVCTARRALTLLFQGQAQAVMNEEDGSFRTFNFPEWRSLSENAPHEESIHAISFRIRVPRVILLLMYDRMP